MLPVANPPALIVEYHALAPASFYWMINALAGDPHANGDSYLVKIGKKPGDEGALQDFREVIDRYRGSFNRMEPSENGYLPIPPSGDYSLSDRFSAIFLSSQNMDEAWSKAEILLSNEDLQRLRSVFDHFERRFDALWRESGYLA
ncbi:MAG TPA: hypothetical protein V6C82_05485, partial [Chroococcales cyanobacterium]